ncbi:DNA polymerase III subunit beta family protein [Streptomyces marianii]|uniref:MerR family transcriptional regulator n=1 Tax=Streptomyces marianii TaxID=1817406 RepID=A0A5R9E3V4_9ACTN|nr:MerR family transcriptional regulator [Streptomyces marianii]TLQ44641.1 MerR family transcriptional regulator [Streptomyces marianii]
MRSIGELARDSGLTVTALRFYDGAGVLVPAQVDPLNGYRWYDPAQLDEARLLARLRRAGMPLTDIRLVMAAWAGEDAALVCELMEAHLRRLERGLADARDAFSTIRTLVERIERRENLTMTTAPSTSAAHTTLSSAGLAAALDSVRFAVGAGGDLPMLAGVLFELDGGELHLVATDRYRMAVARTAADGHDGPAVRITVPAALADAMRALLCDGGPARLTVEGDDITLEAGGRRAGGTGLGHDFPDYRRLTRLPAGQRVAVDVPALRDAVENGPVREGEAGGADGERLDLTVLAPAADGTLAVTGDTAPGPGHVAVNRAFLLQALSAAGGDRLVLELGGPTSPLAVRRPDDEHAFSLLMPVRLEG